MDLLMRIVAIFLLAPALVQGYCDCDDDCDCTYLSTYGIVGLVALGVGILACIGVCIRCVANRRQGYLVSSRLASTAVIQTQSNVPYATLPNVPVTTGPPPSYIQAQVYAPPPPVATQTRIMVSM